MNSSTAASAARAQRRTRRSGAPSNVLRRLTSAVAAGLLLVTGLVVVPATVASAAPAFPDGMTGGDQRTTTGQPFATPVTLRVLDAATAEPLTGIDVAFRLTTITASAAFPGGATQATVTTDANGVATAPLVTAGSVAGIARLSATAYHDGVASNPPSIFLNIDTNAPDPAFTALSGNGQSAAVGTAFAGPFSTRITDEATGAPWTGGTARFRVFGAPATFPNGLDYVDVTPDANGVVTAPTLTAGSTTGQLQMLVRVTYRGVDQGPGNIVLNITSDAPPQGTAPTLAGDPPNGTVGAPYTFAFTLGGDPAPTVESTSALPDGLELDQSTGVLSGTPTEAGTFTLELDAGNSVGSVSHSTTITIADAPPSAPGAPTIDAFSTRSEEVTVEFRPGSAGSPPAHEFRVVATNIRDAADTHAVVGAGSPITVAGLRNGHEYVFTVMAVNTVGEAISAPSDPVLVGRPPSIGGEPVTGTVGEPYSFAFDIGGDPAPTISVEWITPLPPGLTLDPVTGSIGGSPQAPGTYAVRMVAANEVATAIHDVVFVIDGTGVAPDAPSIANVETGYRSLSFDVIPGASGTAPITGYEATIRNVDDPAEVYSAEGEYPRFLIAHLTEGARYTVSLVAVSAAGRSEPTEAGPFTIPVFPELIGTNARGQVGEPFSHAFEMTGSPAPELIIVYPDVDRLPRGLTIDGPAGVIRGIPEESGTFVLTLGAQNVAGCACYEFTLVIDPADAPTPTDPGQPADPIVPVDPEPPAPRGTDGVAAVAKPRSALAVTGADTWPVTVVGGLGLLALAAGLAAIRTGRRPRRG